MIGGFMFPIDKIRTNNLKLLVKEKAKTQKEFANIIGKSEQQLGQWLNNSINTKTKKPRIIGTASCRQLEKIFKLPGGWMDINHSENPNVALAETKLVPLITSIAAGWWTDNVDQRQEKMVSCPVACGEGTFCLEIKGISMTNPDGRPSFEDGDWVFFDPTETLMNGKFVAVELPDGSGTFKKYIEEDGKRYLYALNPDWSPRIMEIPEGAEVRGIAIFKTEKL